MTQMDAALQADLHMHSTSSDGKLSPEELAGEVLRQNIHTMALTDHETMTGLAAAKAAAAASGIRFIPGVEINTAGEEEVHLLFYFVDPSMQELAEQLAAINLDRQLRAQRFVERFGELGIQLTQEDFQVPEGTFCHRPHVADALVRKGYATSRQEAFQRYLAVGRPGYISRMKLDTIKAIELANRLGLVVVLAHPGLIRNQSLTTAEALKTLKEAGLHGIEAHHANHTPAACAYWDKTARNLGLLVTGGSDFHAFKDSHGLIGSHLNTWHEVNKDIEALYDLAAKLKKEDA